MGGKYGKVIGFMCLGLGLVGGTARAGLCQQDKSAPGIPKTSCYFPSCPEGNDCLPPTINRDSATISYQEPLLKWMDVCSDKSLSGACWEVYIDFHFEVDATDPSGVAAVGVHLAQEVNAKRIFRKYIATVDRKNPRNKYEMNATLVSHVPPGQRLDLDVYELCARDGAGNEGCVLPMRRGLFSLGAQ